MGAQTPRRRKAIRLEDVAKKIKISTGTASMALAGSQRVSSVTRRKVLEVCRALGYQPPRSRHRRVEMKAVTRVGLLIIGSQATSPVNIGLLHHLTVQARQRNVRLEVATIEDPDAPHITEQAIQFARPCDTLLLTGNFDASLLRRLATAELRVAALGMAPPEDRVLGLPSAVVIAADDREMGRVATRRLIERGHRRIAFVAEAMRENLSHGRWLEGYQLAHVVAGLDVNPAMIGVVGMDRQYVDPVADRIAPQRPTAAVVTDVPAVSPLLSALRRRGVELGIEDVMAWGHPDLARLHNVPGLPMLGIDVQRWADAALRYAVSPAEIRLQPGSTLYVPFEAWNLPAAGKRRP